MFFKQRRSSSSNGPTNLSFRSSPTNTHEDIIMDCSSPSTNGFAFKTRNTINNIFCLRKKRWDSSTDEIQEAGHYNVSQMDEIDTDTTVSADFEVGIRKSQSLPDFGQVTTTTTMTTISTAESSTRNTESTLCVSDEQKYSSLTRSLSKLLGRALCSPKLKSTLVGDTENSPEMNPEITIPQKQQPPRRQTKQNIVASPIGDEYHRRKMSAFAPKNEPQWNQKTILVSTAKNEPTSKKNNAFAFSRNAAFPTKSNLGPSRDSLSIGEMGEFWIKSIEETKDNKENGKMNEFVNHFCDIVESWNEYKEKEFREQMDVNELELL